MSLHHCRWRPYLDTKHISRGSPRSLVAQYLRPSKPAKNYPSLLVCMLVVELGGSGGIRNVRTRKPSRKQARMPKVCGMVSRWILRVVCMIDSVTVPGYRYYRIFRACTIGPPGQYYLDRLSWYLSLPHTPFCCNQLEMGVMPVMVPSPRQCLTTRDLTISLNFFPVRTVPPVHTPPQYNRDEYYMRAFLSRSLSIMIPW